MKHIVLTMGIILFCALNAHAQQLVYEYDYDHCGNRVIRMCVQLNDRAGAEMNRDSADIALKEDWDNGETMMLYPNPTKESVRFEIQGESKIGNYYLSDISGKTIEKGNCGNNFMILDLSNQKSGIYLLELYVDNKKHFYKVIKQ